MDNNKWDKLFLSKNPEIKARAAAGLLEHGASISRLMEIVDIFLNGEFDLDRANLIRAFSRHPKEDIAVSFLTLFHSKDKMRIDFALNITHYCRVEPAFDQVVDLLQHDDPEIAVSAAHVMKSLNVPIAKEKALDIYRRSKTFLRFPLRNFLLGQGISLYDEEIIRDVPDTLLKSLTSKGLLVSESFEPGHVQPLAIIIAKPVDVKGRFSTTDEACWGDDDTKIDPHSLTLWFEDGLWHVELHMYIPGPGPGDFHHKFKTADEAQADILQYYFG